MTLYYAHTHTHSGTTESKDEEDFDQFLESVKARQLSLTTKGSYNTIISSTQNAQCPHIHIQCIHTHTHTHTLTHAHM